MTGAQVSDARRRRLVLGLVVVAVVGGAIALSKPGMDRSDQSPNIGLASGNPTTSPGVGVASGNPTTSPGVGVASGGPTAPARGAEPAGRKSSGAASSSVATTPSEVYVTGVQSSPLPASEDDAGSYRLMNGVACPWISLRAISSRLGRWLKRVLPFCVSAWRRRVPTL